MMARYKLKGTTASLQNLNLLIGSAFFFLLMCWPSVSLATQIGHIPWELNSGNAAAELSDPYEISPAINLSNRIGAEAFKNVNLLLKQQRIAAVITIAEETIATKPKSGLAFEVLGTALFMDGQWEQAIDALEKAKKLEPEQSGPYTKLGIIYMEKGEIDLAEEHFQKAIDINPNDRFAHQRLGLLFEYKKNYSQAIAHFRAGLEGTPPSYLGVAVNLAGVLNQTRRYQEAINTLEPRLPLSSEIFEAHLILGTAYLQSGIFKSAIDRFERASTLQPESTSAQLGTCIALRKSGETAEALSRLETLVNKTPDWLPGIMELGEAQLVSGQVGKATNTFSKGVSLGANPVKIQKRLATYYLQNKQLDKAEGIYRHLIDSGKGDSESFSKLSEIYQSRGEHNEGIALLNKGIQTVRDDGYLHFRLGAYLASIGRYDESLPMLQHANIKAPNDPNFLRALNMAQVKAGKHEEAVVTAGELYTLFPDSSSDAINYASRLLENGEIKKSEAIYRQALAAFPDNPVIQNNLANLLADEEKFAEAEKLAEAANSTLEGKNASILDTLGWILYRQGHFEKALEALLAATTLAPNTASFQYHLGMTLSATDNREGARKSLEKAIKLAPKATWAMQANKELEKLR